MSRKINARRFSKVMRDLARVPSQAARNISDDIKKEITAKMDAGQDPYGRPWRKKRDGSTSRLEKTGAGRASIDVSPTRGAGFHIVVGVLYMIYHQFGGKSHLRGHKKHPNFGRDQDRSGGRNKPPKRSFLPFERLPATWLAIVKRRLEQAARRRIARG